MGKELSQDSRNEKNTYVASFGLDAAKKYVADESEKAINDINDIFPESGAKDEIIMLVKTMVNREK